MFKKKKIVLRLIAVVLCASFGASDLAWAAPPASVLRNPLSFEAPLDFCVLKAVHHGPSDKFIIHIQDAHANLSGQENLAAAIERLMSRYGVRLVLSEGGSGDCSLTPLKSIASQATWRRVAKNYLVKGKLKGEEYLNLTSSHPMKIRGIEDMGLYLESVEDYGRLARKREELLGKIGRLRSALAKLKRKIYPPELARYEAVIVSNDHLATFKALVPLAAEKSIRLEKYPALERLAALAEKEKSVNFEAASLEQAALIEEVARRGGKEDLETHFQKVGRLKDEKLSLYTYFQNTLNISKKNGITLEKYPDYLKYGEYLGEYTRMDLGNVLEELETLENEVYSAALTTEDGQRLRAIDRYTRLLETACRIQMTTEEFNLFEANAPDFSTAPYQGFLNRKLAEAGYFTDLVPYDNLEEEAKGFLKKFYGSVAERDLAFLANTEKALQAENPATTASAGKRIAVLIAGGYHTEHLKKLFEEKGWSYAVLAPLITAETNQKKYERLLLEPFEKKFGGESVWRVTPPPQNADGSVPPRRAEKGSGSAGPAKPAHDQSVEERDNISTASLGLGLSDPASVDLSDSPEGIRKAARLYRAKIREVGELIGSTATDSPAATKWKRHLAELDRDWAQTEQTAARTALRKPSLQILEDDLREQSSGFRAAVGARLMSFVGGTADLDTFDKNHVFFNVERSTIVTDAKTMGAGRKVDEGLGSYQWIIQLRVFFQLFVYSFLDVFRKGHEIFSGSRRKDQMHKNYASPSSFSISLKGIQPFLSASAIDALRLATNFGFRGSLDSILSISQPAGFIFLSWYSPVESLSTRALSMSDNTSNKANVSKANNLGEPFLSTKTTALDLLSSLKTDAGASLENGTSFPDVNFAGRFFIRAKYSTFLNAVSKIFLQDSAGGIRKAARLHRTRIREAAELIKFTAARTALRNPSLQILEENLREHRSGFRAAEDLTVTEGGLRKAGLAEHGNEVRLGKNESSQPAGWQNAGGRSVPGRFGRLSQGGERPDAGRPRNTPGSSPAERGAVPVAETGRGRFADQGSPNSFADTPPSLGGPRPGKALVRPNPAQGSDRHSDPLRVLNSNEGRLDKIQAFLTSAGSLTGGFRGVKTAAREGLRETSLQILEDDLREQHSGFRSASTLGARLAAHHDSNWPKATVENLMALLREDNEFIDGLAQTIIWEIGPAAVPQLIAVMEKNPDNPALLQSITEALGQIGPSASQAVPPLIAVMERHPNDSALLRPITKALETIQPDTSKLLEDFKQSVGRESLSDSRSLALRLGRQDEVTANKALEVLIEKYADKRQEIYGSEEDGKKIAATEREAKDQLWNDWIEKYLAIVAGALLYHQADKLAQVHAADASVKSDDPPTFFISSGLEPELANQDKLPSEGGLEVNTLPFRTAGSLERYLEALYRLPAGEFLFIISSANTHLNLGLTAERKKAVETTRLGGALRVLSYLLLFPDNPPGRHRYLMEKIKDDKFEIKTNHLQLTQETGAVARLQVGTAALWKGTDKRRFVQVANWLGWAIGQDFETLKPIILEIVRLYKQERINLFSPNAQDDMGDEAQARLKGGILKIMTDAVRAKPTGVRHQSVGGPPSVERTSTLGARHSQSAPISALRGTRPVDAAEGGVSTGARQALRRSLPRAESRGSGRAAENNSALAVGVFAGVDAVNYDVAPHEVKTDAVFPDPETMRGGRNIHQRPGEGHGPPGVDVNSHFLKDSFLDVLRKFVKFTFAGRGIFEAGNGNPRQLSPNFLTAFSSGIRPVCLASSMPFLSLVMSFGLSGRCFSMASMSQPTGFLWTYASSETLSSSPASAAQSRSHREYVSKTKYFGEPFLSSMTAALKSFGNTKPDALRFLGTAANSFSSWIFTKSLAASLTSEFGFMSAFLPRVRLKYNTSSGVVSKTFLLDSQGTRGERPAIRQSLPMNPATNPRGSLKVVGFRAAETPSQWRRILDKLPRDPMAWVVGTLVTVTLVSGLTVLMGLAEGEDAVRRFQNALGHNVLGYMFRVKLAGGAETYYEFNINDYSVKAVSPEEVAKRLQSKEEDRRRLDQLLEKGGSRPATAGARQANKTEIKIDVEGGVIELIIQKVSEDNPLRENEMYRLPSTGVGTENIINRSGESNSISYTVRSKERNSLLAYLVAIPEDEKIKGGDPETLFIFATSVIQGFQGSALFFRLIAIVAKEGRDKGYKNVSAIVGREGIQSGVHRLAFKGKIRHFIVDQGIAMRMQLHMLSQDSPEAIKQKQIDAEVEEINKIENRREWLRRLNLLVMENENSLVELEIPIDRSAAAGVRHQSHAYRQAGTKQEKKDLRDYLRNVYRKRRIRFIHSDSRVGIVVDAKDLLGLMASESHYDTLSKSLAESYIRLNLTKSDRESRAKIPHEEIEAAISNMQEKSISFWLLIRKSGHIGGYVLIDEHNDEPIDYVRSVVKGGGSLLLDAGLDYLWDKGVKQVVWSAYPKVEGFSREYLKRRGMVYSERDAAGSSGESKKVFKVSLDHQPSAQKTRGVRKAKGSRSALSRRTLLLNGIAPGLAAVGVVSVGAGILRYLLREDPPKPASVPPPPKAEAPPPPAPPAEIDFAKVEDGYFRKLLEDRKSLEEFFRAIEPVVDPSLGERGNEERLARRARFLAHLLATVEMVENRNGKSRQVEGDALGRYQIEYGSAADYIKRAYTLPSPIAQKLINYFVSRGWIKNPMIIQSLSRAGTYQENKIKRRLTLKEANQSVKAALMDMKNDFLQRLIVRLMIFFYDEPLEMLEHAAKWYKTIFNPAPGKTSYYQFIAVWLMLSDVYDRPMAEVVERWEELSKILYQKENELEEKYGKAKTSWREAWVQIEVSRKLLEQKESAPLSVNSCTREINALVKQDGILRVLMETEHLLQKEEEEKAAQEKEDRKKKEAPVKKEGFFDRHEEYAIRQWYLHDLHGTRERIRQLGEELQRERARLEEAEKKRRESLRKKSKAPGRKPSALPGRRGTRSASILSPPTEQLERLRQGIAEGKVSAGPIQKVLVLNNNSHILESMRRPVDDGIDYAEFELVADENTQGALDWYDTAASAAKPFNLILVNADVPLSCALLKALQQREDGKVSKTPVILIGRDLYGYIRQYRIETSALGPEILGAQGLEGPMQERLANFVRLIHTSRARAAENLPSLGEGSLEKLENPAETASYRAKTARYRVLKDMSLGELEQLVGAMEENTQIARIDVIGNIWVIYHDPKVHASATVPAGSTVVVWFDSRNPARKARKKIVAEFAEKGAKNNLPLGLAATLDSIAGPIDKGTSIPELRVKVLKFAPEAEDPTLVGADPNREIVIGFLGSSVNPLTYGQTAAVLLAIDQWRVEENGRQVRMDMGVVCPHGEITHKPVDLRDQVSVEGRHEMARLGLDVFYPLIRDTDVARDNSYVSEKNLHEIFRMNPEKKIRIVFISGSDSEAYIKTVARNLAQYAASEGFGQNPNHKLQWVVVRRGKFGETLTKEKLHQIIVGLILESPEAERPALEKFFDFTLDPNRISVVLNPYARDLSGTDFRAALDSRSVSTAVYRLIRKRGYYGWPSTVAIEKAGEFLTRQKDHNVQGVVFFRSGRASPDVLEYLPVVRKRALWSPKKWTLWSKVLACRMGFKVAHSGATEPFPLSPEEWGGGDELAYALLAARSGLFVGRSGTDEAQVIREIQSLTRSADQIFPSGTRQGTSAEDAEGTRRAETWKSHLDRLRPFATDKKGLYYLQALPVVEDALRFLADEMAKPGEAYLQAIGPEAQGLLSRQTHLFDLLLAMEPVVADWAKKEKQPVEATKLFYQCLKTVYKTFIALAHQGGNDAAREDYYEKARPLIELAISFDGKTPTGFGAEEKVFIRIDLAQNLSHQKHYEEADHLCVELQEGRFGPLGTNRSREVLNMRGYIRIEQARQKFDQMRASKANAVFALRSQMSARIREASEFFNRLIGDYKDGGEEDPAQVARAYAGLAAMENLERDYYFAARRLGGRSAASARKVRHLDLGHAVEALHYCARSFAYTSPAKQKAFDHTRKIYEDTLAGLAVSLQAVGSGEWTPDHLRAVLPLVRKLRAVLQELRDLPETVGVDNKKSVIDALAPIESVLSRIQEQTASKGDMVTDMAGFGEKVRGFIAQGVVHLAHTRSYSSAVEFEKNFRGDLRSYAEERMKTDPEVPHEFHERFQNVFEMNLPDFEIGLSDLLVIHQAASVDPKKRNATEIGRAVRSQLQSLGIQEGVFRPAASETEILIYVHNRSESVLYQFLGVDEIPLVNAAISPKKEELLAYNMGEAKDFLAKDRNAYLRVEVLYAAVGPWLAVENPFRKETLDDLRRKAKSALRKYEEMVVAAEGSDKSEKTAKLKECTVHRLQGGNGNPGQAEILKELERLLQNDASKAREKILALVGNIEQDESYARGLAQRHSFPPFEQHAARLEEIRVEMTALTQADNPRYLAKDMLERLSEEAVEIREEVLLNEEYLTEQADLFARLNGRLRQAEERAAVLAAKDGVPQTLRDSLSAEARKCRDDFESAVLGWKLRENEAGVSAQLESLNQKLDVFEPLFQRRQALGESAAAIQDFMRIQAVHGGMAPQAASPMDPVLVSLDAIAPGTVEDTRAYASALSEAERRAGEIMRDLQTAKHTLVAGQIEELRGFLLVGIDWMRNDILPKLGLPDLMAQNEREAIVDFNSASSAVEDLFNRLSADFETEEIQLVFQKLLSAFGRIVHYEEREYTEKLLETLGEQIVGGLDQVVVSTKQNLYGYPTGLDVYLDHGDGTHTPLGAYAIEFPMWKTYPAFGRSDTPMNEHASFPFMDYMTAMELALLAYLDMTGESRDLRVPSAAQVFKTAYEEVLYQREEKKIGFVYAKEDGSFGAYGDIGQPNATVLYTPKGQIGFIVNVLATSFLDKLFRIRGVENSDPDAPTKKWLEVMHRKNSKIAFLPVTDHSGSVVRSWVKVLGSVAVQPLALMNIIGRAWLIFKKNGHLGTEDVRSLLGAWSNRFDPGARRFSEYLLPNVWEYRQARLEEFRLMLEEILQIKDPLVLVEEVLMKTPRQAFEDICVAAWKSFIRAVDPIEPGWVTASSRVFFWFYPDYQALIADWMENTLYAGAEKPETFAWMPFVFPFVSPDIDRVLETLRRRIASDHAERMAAITHAIKGRPRPQEIDEFLNSSTEKDTMTTGFNFLFKGLNHRGKEHPALLTLAIQKLNEVEAAFFMLFGDELRRAGRWDEYLSYFNLKRREAQERIGRWAGPDAAPFTFERPVVTGGEKREGGDRAALRQAQGAAKEADRPAETTSLSVQSSELRVGRSQNQGINFSERQTLDSKLNAGTRLAEKDFREPKNQQKQIYYGRTADIDGVGDALLDESIVTRPEIELNGSVEDKDQFDLRSELSEVQRNIRQSRIRHRETWQEMNLHGKTPFRYAVSWCFAGLSWHIWWQSLLEPHSLDLLLIPILVLPIAYFMKAIRPYEFKMEKLKEEIALSERQERSLAYRLSRVLKAANEESSPQHGARTAKETDRVVAVEIPKALRRLAGARLSKEEAIEKINRIADFFERLGKKERWESGITCLRGAVRILERFKEEEFDWEFWEAVLVRLSSAVVYLRLAQAVDPNVETDPGLQRNLQEALRIIRIREAMDLLPLRPEDAEERNALIRRRLERLAQGVKQLMRKVEGAGLGSNPRVEGIVETLSRIPKFNDFRQVAQERREGLYYDFIASTLPDMVLDVFLKIKVLQKEDEKAASALAKILWEEGLSEDLFLHYGVGEFLAFEEPQEVEGFAFVEEEGFAGPIDRAKERFSREAEWFVLGIATSEEAAWAVGLIKALADVYESDQLFRIYLDRAVHGIRGRHEPEGLFEESLKKSVGTQKLFSEKLESISSAEVLRAVLEALPAEGPVSYTMNLGEIRKRIEVIEGGRGAKEADRVALVEILEQDLNRIPAWRGPSNARGMAGARPANRQDRAIEIWKGIDPQTVLEFNREGGYSLSRVSNSTGYREWVVHEIERRYGRGIQILSLAAGRGDLEAALSDDGQLVTAVELDPNFMSAMRQKGVQNVVKGDVRDLKSLLPDENKYHLIVISEAIGTLGLDTIRDAASYLEPGGAVLLFEFPYDNREQEFLRRQLFPTNRVKPEEVEAAFKVFGFDGGSFFVQPSPSFQDDRATYNRPMVMYGAVKGGRLAKSFQPQFLSRPIEIFVPPARRFSSLPATAQALEAMPPTEWTELLDELAAFSDELDHGSTVGEDIFSLTIKSDLQGKEAELLTFVSFAKQKDQSVRIRFEGVDHQGQRFLVKEETVSKERIDAARIKVRARLQRASSARIAELIQSQENFKDIELENELQRITLLAERVDSLITADTPMVLTLKNYPLRDRSRFNRAKEKFNADHPGAYLELLDENNHIVESDVPEALKDSLPRMVITLPTEGNAEWVRSKGYSILPIGVDGSSRESYPLYAHYAVMVLARAIMNLKLDPNGKLEESALLLVQLHEALLPPDQRRAFDTQNAGRTYEFMKNPGSAPDVGSLLSALHKASLWPVRMLSWTELKRVLDLSQETDRFV